MISPARQIAFDILQKVHHGGYASDLLLQRSAQLDSRDAGLASEIVFGCLRFQAQLDYLIARRTTRPLDPEVRIALRMGIYQLRYLDRIPPHAAVDESVELVKRRGRAPAAGLVNAILRKTDRQPVPWPNRATELSMPPWLLEKWDGQFGRQTTDQIAAAFLRPAESNIASTGRIQDIGAQSIVPLLDLHPGHTFLDLCAAPGNKTAQAIQQGVRAIACDIHLHRLKQMRDLNCSLVVLDGTQPLPFRAKFDRVLFDRILVDAPCTGTGTLGRNPEIKWRLKPSDLLDLHAKQVALVRQALEHLCPGGRLVYSTCSLEMEENELVIQEITRQEIPGSWQTTERLPGLNAGDGFFAAVLSR
jgi:16S rRNA (cytosine967-C5)-methyltransferase